MRLTQKILIQTEMERQLVHAHGLPLLQAKELAEDLAGVVEQTLQEEIKIEEALAEDREAFS